MTAILELTWDSRDLSVWRGGKVEGALTLALRRAGDAAIRALQTESTKRITGRKYLRSKTVRDSLPITFPGRKAALQHLVWVQKVSGEPVPLSRFPHRQTRKGVVVRVNRGGGAQLIRSAFLATMRSGHLGVFKRQGKDRLPIQELWTTRISDTMQDQGAIPALQAKAVAKFDSVFARALPREMGKLRAKGLA